MSLISGILIGVAFILLALPMLITGFVLNTVAFGIYLLIVGIVCIVEALTGDLRTRFRRSAA